MIHESLGGYFSAHKFIILVTIGFNVFPHGIVSEGNNITLINITAESVGYSQQERIPAAGV